MLVLQRKIGQKLVIGNGVVITVLGGNGTQVRIGIEAPADVHIRREELPQRPLPHNRLRSEHGV